MNIDLLSQIPKLLKELISIVQEPFDKRRQRRNDFFKNEIAPIHQMMESIHADYTASFSELLELLHSQKDIKRTVELLKKRRLVLLAKRKDAEAYADELTNVKKRGYIKQREISTFIEFADAIRNYLRKASPTDARFSWYSGFIDEFESIVRRGESPFLFKRFASIETGTPPVELVRNAYSEAIQRDMPEAWKKYAAAYQKLKLELTR